jgi:hypothetical protein
MDQNRSDKNRVRAIVIEVIWWVATCILLLGLFMVFGPNFPEMW